MYYHFNLTEEIFTKTMAYINLYVMEWTVWIKIHQIEAIIGIVFFTKIPSYYLYLYRSSQYTFNSHTKKS